MVPFLFLLVFLRLICSAAGTLSLSLPNDPFTLNTNVTLLWTRQPQDPQQFVLQTIPPSQLDNSVVDAQNATGTVNLVFHELGAFSLQAVDLNNSRNLLQETPTFYVQVAQTSTSTTTATKVFNPHGIITIIQTQSPSSTTVVTSTQTTVLDQPPPTTSPIQSSSNSSKTNPVIIVGIIVAIVVVCILIALAYFLKRRKDNTVRRHTFHRDMMTRDPTLVLPPVPQYPADVYVHRGSTFEVMPPAPPPKETTCWISRAPNQSNSTVDINGSQQWISREPNQSNSMVDVNGSRQQLVSRPLPVPNVQGQRLQFADVPKINTQRLSHVRRGSDEYDLLTAGTTVSTTTAEMRMKMREALEKMRRMRQSGQQQLPPPGLDLTA